MASHARLRCRSTLRGLSCWGWLRHIEHAGRGSLPSDARDGDVHGGAGLPAAPQPAQAERAAAAAGRHHRMGASTWASISARHRSRPAVRGRDRRAARRAMDRAPVHFFRCRTLAARATRQRPLLSGGIHDLPDQRQQAFARTGQAAAGRGARTTRSHAFHPPTGARSIVIPCFNEAANPRTCCHRSRTSLGHACAGRSSWWTTAAPMTSGDLIPRRMAGWLLGARARAPIGGLAAVARIRAVMLLWQAATDRVVNGVWPQPPGKCCKNCDAHHRGGRERGRARESGWSSWITLAVLITAEAASAQTQAAPVSNLVEIRSANLKPGTRERFHQLFVKTSLPMLHRWKVDVAFGPRSTTRTRGSSCAVSQPEVSAEKRGRVLWREEWIKVRERPCSPTSCELCHGHHQHRSCRRRGTCAGPVRASPSGGRHVDIVIV